MIYLRLILAVLFVYSYYAIFMNSFLNDGSLVSGLAFSIIITAISIVLYFYAKWYFYAKKHTIDKNSFFVENVFLPGMLLLVFSIPFSLKAGFDFRFFWIFYIFIAFLLYDPLHKISEILWDIRFYEVESYSDNGILNKKQLSSLKVKNIAFFVFFPLVSLVISKFYFSIF